MLKSIFDLEIERIVPERLYQKRQSLEFSSDRKMCVSATKASTKTERSHSKG